MNTNAHKEQQLTQKMIYIKVLKMQCICLVRNFQKEQKRARILNTMIWHIKVP